MTVAFTIKRPWPARWPGRIPHGWYWPALVTIWHVDPETDGTDNSCGWFLPPSTTAHRALVAELVTDDLHFPYFSSPSVQQSGVVVDPEYDYRELQPGDALALISTAWTMIAWRLERRRLTPADLVAIHDLACTRQDNLRHNLVMEPGERQDTKKLLERFFYSVLRNYLRFRRPWYRKPRWHVWHWRIQIEPLLCLKRWLFSRCCVCGKRFRYGESPTSPQWDSGGPRWFHGEPHVAHGRCYGQVIDGPSQAEEKTL